MPCVRSRHQAIIKGWVPRERRSRSLSLMYSGALAALYVGTCVRVFFLGL